METNRGEMFVATYRKTDNARKVGHVVRCFVEGQSDGEAYRLTREVLAEVYPAVRVVSVRDLTAAEVAAVRKGEAVSP